MDALVGLFSGNGVPAVAVLTLVFSAVFALAALWLVLPVAVFGVRAAVRELLTAQQEATRELGELRRCLEALAAQGARREAKEEADPPKLTL